MSGAPLKRSSVHHLHVHERARFAVEHGWEIAASFGDAGAEKNAALQGVALADVSWLGKLECKGPWAASLAGQSVAGGIACPVTPERLLWIVEPPSIVSARKTLESLRAGQARCYLIDTSSVHASFELVGPHVSDVLCKLASARPEIGSPIFASVGGVRSLFIRSERGLQLHFQREFGEYLWESLLDAGKEFGIRAVGVEALTAARAGA
jgi:glycine cleavage system aminomethyltransferase T